MKKKQKRISWCFNSTYFCFIDCTYGFFIGTAVASEGQEDGFLPLLALPLMIKAMSGKRVTSAGSRYNNMDHLDIAF